MSASFTPDRIIVTVRFEAITAKESGNVQNDTRRTLMGLPGAKSLPKEIAKVIGQDVLAPYQFALIKEPKKYESDEKIEGKKMRSKTINLAAGAIQVYFYTGPWEKLEDTCVSIKNVCQQITRTAKSMKWSSFEIYVAKEV